MRRLRVSAYAWVVAAALGGCAAGEVEYGADVRVTSPELVAIGPGVQVIADADDPLFYADGYYWLYRDSVWLRSDSYRGGFARIDVNMVPYDLRNLDRPVTYAHYSRHHQTNYARGAQVQTRAQRPQPQAAPMPPMREPPVPNAIPGHEGAANQDQNPTLPSQRHDDLDKDRDHDNNATRAEPKGGQPDRKYDTDRDMDKDKLKKHDYGQ